MQKSRQLKMQKKVFLSDTNETNNQNTDNIKVTINSLGR